MSSPPPPPPAWQPPPPPHRAEHVPADPPPAAQQHEEPGHQHHDGHEHTRLALLIALSIALVSVLGAVVGWRAEVHAAKASRYEQDAVAATISSAQLRSEAEAEAAKAYSQFAHYQRLGHEADELMPDACTSDERSNIVALDAGVLCSTQIQFGGYGGTGYVDAQGHFNIEKYALDVQDGNAAQNDIEPDTYETQAGQERHDEDNMLYLSLFLVLSLALLTLARLGKTTSSRLALAVPGWVCLIGGIAALITAEV
ncbi:MAG TPA: hypothetical protein VFE19_13695 [Jatrophihabitantaceae bacterium]|jgi:hypothetical protein|nr:hypothetical protein [Jatrophihabitantaceae bacterium]